MHTSTNSLWTYQYSVDCIFIILEGLYSKTEQKQIKCIWYKQQGYKSYTGHVHTDCQKLKIHKESSAGKSKDNESNDNKANIAIAS
jgi:hypothetical protein